MKKKRENKFTGKFRIWAKKNFDTCAIEVKHTRGKEFFDCRELKEHQYYSLMAAAGKHGLAYKIPDDSIGYKPFDLILLKRAPAFVVIKYDQGAVGIKIEDWDRRWTRLHFDKALALSAFFVKSEDVK